ncbi:hypothetical protein [Streptomyces sp. NPDC004528]|uniref:hypothetical protein n=1 Tax=Streptomyces sp. NPDC004528 TaxID=3154550 RepID=UPI0033AEDDCD
MYARTTEITRPVMYASLATVPPVLVAPEHANPTVIGVICAPPAALAVPILPLARLGGPRTSGRDGAQHGSGDRGDATSGDAHAAESSLELRARRPPP